METPNEQNVLLDMEVEQIRKRLKCTARQQN